MQPARTLLSSPSPPIASSSFSALPASNATRNSAHLPHSSSSSSSLPRTSNSLLSTAKTPYSNSASNKASSSLSSPSSLSSSSPSSSFAHVKSSSATTSSSSSLDALSIPFPYQAYPQQELLMRRIIELIENSDADEEGRLWAHVGIFESPTGTGKSLSLICSTLHWLCDRRTRIRSSASSAFSSASSSANLASSTSSSSQSRELSWIQEFAAQNRDEVANEEIKQQALIEETRKSLVKEAEALKAQRSLHAMSSSSSASKQPLVRGRKRISIDDELELESANTKKDAEDEDLLLNWEAGAESTAAEVSADDAAGVPAWKQLLAQESHEQQKIVQHVKRERLDEALLSELRVRPQLIICSRTHSQLTQLVNEVRKTVFKDRVRVLALGSRMQLCQNADVKSLSSAQRINDACLELQKGSSAAARAKRATSSAVSVKAARSAIKHGPCPYLENPQAQRVFRQFALTSIHDVEELANLGQRVESCAYYNARSLLDSVHIIAIPYQSLLSRATRESLGIDNERLRQSIVIFDEAHNLVETIDDLHSFSLTQRALAITYQRLQQYELRFKERLKESNLLMLQQLAQVAHAAAKLIEAHTANEPRLLSMSAFITECSIDAVNLFDLHAFILGSELHKKIGGFVERFYDRFSSLGEDGVGNKAASSTRVASCIHELDALIDALGHRNADGRLVLERGRLRFFLLNASVVMKPIIQRARAVLFIGGTMQPFEHHRSQLLQELPLPNFHTLACDHVIEPQRVMCASLSVGPTNHALDFSFAHRTEPSTLDELGRILLNLCTIVPKGLVVFFCSHAALTAAIEHWQSDRTLETIEKKKKCFVENSQESIEELLAQYSRHIANEQQGALMLAVVGGRLSEGINFNDDLCRLVVMVGLPYANKHDLELKTRMSHAEERHKGAGEEYYHHLCMRQINQSIGRAIRHAHDYAAILLLDGRYAAPRVQKALPQWIQARSSSHSSFATAFRAIKTFYEQMKLQRSVPQC